MNAIVEGNILFKAHPSDSGYDLLSIEDYVIKSGERKLFKTGIKLQLPKGYEAQVRSKSGLALKKGLHVLNSPGTIDTNYRGDIGVILHNASDEDVEITKGMKIAQLVFGQVVEITLINGTVDDTDRGSNGFGSSGK